MMRNVISILTLVTAVTIPAVSSALDVEDKAPGFEALSTEGTVILSEFEGKNIVVLALYYADFTPV